MLPGRCPRKSAEPAAGHPVMSIPLSALELCRRPRRAVKNAKHDAVLRVPRYAPAINAIIRLYQSGRADRACGGLGALELCAGWLLPSESFDRRTGAAVGVDVYVCQSSGLSTNQALHFQSRTRRAAATACDLPAEQRRIRSRDESNKDLPFTRRQPCLIGREVEKKNNNSTWPSGTTSIHERICPRQPHNRPQNSHATI